ncbi:MAG TPA: response regulator [Polyangiaceae bacterium]
MTAWPPARILVAEDDTELRALIAAKLRSSGFEVVEVRDGEGLLGRLVDAAGPSGTAEGYDMVVSDVRMPEFTALDVLVGARRLLAGMPVLLITAFGDEKLHERARRLGATEVLDKPISMNELGTRVCRMLAERKPEEVHSGAH